MLATLLRSLQIGLGALCLYLLYLAVLPLVSASPIRDIEQAEIRRSQPADTQPAHYAVISTRNLFKTRAAPVKIDTQGSELDEEHPESKLRIALVGTLASTNPRLSIATVQDQTSRESLMLRVGDDIKGAEIERIERRRIVVRNRGKLEQVTLEEELAKAKTPSRARTRSAHTRRPNRVRQRRPPPPVETPASSSSVGNVFDAATFIRQNIAQTVLNERGNYGQCTQPRLHPTSTLARTPCRYAQARPRPDTCRTDRSQG